MAQNVFESPTASKTSQPSLHILSTSVRSVVIAVPCLGNIDALRVNCNLEWRRRGNCSGAAGDGMRSPLRDVVVPAAAKFMRTLGQYGNRHSRANLERAAMGNVTT